MTSVPTTQNDFYTLDRDGQIARWDALASQALAHFGLPESSFRLVNYTNNAVYAVEAGSERYALRLHRPGLKSKTWIESELMWLRALGEGSELDVPVPAAPLYTGQLQGVEQPVYGVLFHWLDGEPVHTDTLTSEAMHTIGAFIAWLHQQSQRFTPPADFERPTLDFEGLFGSRSPYQPSPEGEALITPAQREVIARTTERIRDVMSALDGQRPDSFGLIHADLIAKNLLWQDNEHGHVHVAALDFDDCAFGYRLYDLTPLLWVLKDEPDYIERRNALWDGYHTNRDSLTGTIDQLEALVAARHIASIRWVAGNVGNPAIRDRAPEIIASRIPALEHFLTTGRLSYAE
jgi:Ser/Thr protein kinase RdoA (MazF antagonist)